jgi:hypothetical protein
VSFVKFFNFDVATGQRQLTVDLDGRGQKAMPGPCAACHGGRADALTPPDATGLPLFPLLQNSVSQKRGDLQAHLMPLEVGTFDFSTSPGFTRAEQEAALKQINRMVLCSYPIPVASVFPEDACRRAATFGEYRGTAAAFLKGRTAATDYRMPSIRTLSCRQGGRAPDRARSIRTSSPTRAAPAISCAASGSSLTSISTHSPSSRVSRTASRFTYTTAATCRSRSSSSTTSGAPPSRTRWLRFFRVWALPRAMRRAPSCGPEGRSRTLGPTEPSHRDPRRFLQPAVFTQPHLLGRLVSGPDGTVPPVNVSLANGTSVQATFNASANGTYVVQLVTGDGTTQSVPVQLRLVVNAALAPAPSVHPVLGYQDDHADHGLHCMPYARRARRRSSLRMSTGTGMA